MPVIRNGACEVGYEFSRGRIVVGDGSVTGPERIFRVVESDQRSVQLAGIDLSKIHFERACQPGFQSPRGEDALKKIKANNLIRLDAEVFLAIFRKWELLDNREEEFPLLRNLWDYQDESNLVCLHFDGTIYGCQLQNGRRFSSMMYFQSGQWYKGFDPLDHHRSHATFSVLYAQ